MNLYIGLMPWMALRRSRLRSCPRPLRCRQILAIPAAPAMIGMLMQAPSRWRLGKIGSSPTNLMVPPVSSGERPRSFMTDRKWVSTSNPPEVEGRVDVRDVVELLVLIVIPLIG